MTNCRDFSASAADRDDCSLISRGAVAGPANAGGRRIRSEIGIIETATILAIICMALRQSWPSISQAASGDMVMGAMPMPAETRDTARLRWVSNHPVTLAMIGTMIAAPAAPTSKPKAS